MRTSIISFVLISFMFLISPVSALADDHDSSKPIRFELTIKPNQQYARIKLDGDDHRQIQLKAEYIKLNPATNNHHIKITITNNSGQVLYHQLVLIDKVEHSEVKYPDSTTDYIKSDDGKQITKTLPYYNYGNIKPAQATPREWYLSNTGKDEIEVKGYIINKEIPVVLDPKIAAANPGVAATLTAYITALRDNDLNGVIATLAKPSQYFGQDLPKEYTDAYNKYPGTFLESSLIYSNPLSIRIINHFCYIDYMWTDPITNNIYPVSINLEHDDNSNKWLIIK